MRDPEEFDAFYKDVRDRVLLETYALTGDLPVSRAAVRDSFAVAWHHWRKVSRLDDPEAWLRPLAWGRAQRRSTARIWHRKKDLDADAKTTLDALSKLSMPQRKALILTNLSPLSLVAISREVGLPQTDVERELQTATAQFAISRDTGTTEIRAHLEHLRTVTDTAQWPRVSIVRRAGAARRRTHTLVGVAGAALVLIAGGTFVSQGNTATASLDNETFDSPSAAADNADGKADDGPTLKDDVLLAAPDLDPLDPKMSWVESGTDDNAGGNGLALPCQIQRYADPQRAGAFVRTFDGTGPRPKPIKTKGTKKQTKAAPAPRSTAWELVELSDSEKAAQAAYSTVNGWYAGCLAERTQLLSVHRVGQVGDDARVFTLRSWKGAPRTLRVGIARSGQMTVTTVSRVDGLQPSPRKPAALLAAAVNRVCSAPGGNACAGEPALKEVDAPVAGLVPGMLSEFDLPPIARAPGPWIGTEPVKAKVNVASTRCDRTTFTGKNVRNNLTRTFLFPAVDKANEFGLTETVGIWSPGNARTFVKDVRKRVSACAENAFGTEVRQLRTVAGKNIDVTAWNISMEISDKDSVQFLMAIVRSGGTVAQVGFVPSQAMSMDREDFLTVVDRALTRLPQLQTR